MKEKTITLKDVEKIRTKAVKAATNYLTQYNDDIYLMICEDLDLFFQTKKKEESISQKILERIEKRYWDVLIAIYDEKAFIRKVRIF